MKRILLYILSVLCLGIGLSANSAELPIGSTEALPGTPGASQIQLLPFLFDCGPAAGEFKCTVRTPIKSFTTKQSFVPNYKYKKEFFTLQGEQGTVLYLESEQGLGSEILANCQRLALKSQESARPMTIIVNWVSTPPIKDHQDPSSKQLQISIGIVSPAYVSAVECFL